MSLASRLHTRSGRRTAAPRPARRVCAAAIELERRRCVAGETVSGRVRGGAGQTAVALVRLEARPGVRREYVVAEAEAAGGDGEFALSVPSAALPTATGERCALLYAAIARGAEGMIAPAQLRVSTTASPHLHTARTEADRLLAAWDARHFHIELVDARLEAGGRLAGRVHRHGRWPPGTIEVRARCLECWRRTPWAERGTPQWHQACLWDRAHPLQVDPDAGWAAFCFELPDGLPPAVEARTIAWRYELLAQRRVRLWLGETAALTPLLHEDSAIRIA